MRIIITQNVTLDGRVEMLDDWFDPQAQDDELLAEVRSQTAREQLLLLGRQTFEDFRGYWSGKTDDTTGISAQMDKVDKWVFSSTMTDPQWENSRVMSTDPRLVVAGLRDQPGLDAILTGRSRSPTSSSPPASSMSTGCSPIPSGRVAVADSSPTGTGASARPARFEGVPQWRRLLGVHSRRRGPDEPVSAAPGPSTRRPPAGRTARSDPRLLAWQAESRHRSNCAKDQMVGRTRRVPLRRGACRVRILRRGLRSGGDFAGGRSEPGRRAEHRRHPRRRRRGQRRDDHEGRLRPLYETQYQQMMMQAQQGGRPVDEEGLKKQTAENLVSTKPLSQEADKRGIEATDDDVSTALDETAQASQMSKDDFLAAMADQGMDEKKVHEGAHPAEDRGPHRR